MTEGVEKETKQKIINLISALLPDVKIYLFGSRARKTHRRSSDIDIALDAGHPLPREIVDEVISIFSATNIMEKIEVVDLHQVSQEMRNTILKEGILWKSQNKNI